MPTAWVKGTDRSGRDAVQEDLLRNVQQKTEINENVYGLSKMDRQSETIRIF